MLVKGFVAACAVVLPFAAFGQVVWDQEPGTDGFGIFSDGISTNGSQFYQTATADNFSLSSAAKITDVEFWGGSEDFEFADLTNFQAFDIYVYDSNFNAVYSTQVSTASLNPVNTGTLNSSNNGGEIFSFNLSTSINLSAGNYFLHVGSINVDPNGDAFIWDDSATGDGSYAFNYFDGNGWQIISGGDLAFKLTAAPEPASLSLLALGGLALIRRRRA